MTRASLLARLAALEKADAAPTFDIRYFFACLFRSPGDAPPMRSTKLVSVAEYYQQLMGRRNGNT